MSGKKRTSSVRVDVKKNRLLITLRGNIRKGDTEAIYTDVRFGVRDLKPGFIVITDTRECKLAYLASVTPFANILSFLKENGLSRSIRIISKSNIILQQMNKVTRSIKGYSVDFVYSMEEAEQLLNETPESDRETG